MDDILFEENVFYWSELVLVDSDALSEICLDKME